jgi:hypothetical protein
MLHLLLPSPHARIYLVNRRTAHDPIFQADFKKALQHVRLKSGQSHGFQALCITLQMNKSVWIKVFVCQGITPVYGQRLCGQCVKQLFCAVTWVRTVFKRNADVATFQEFQLCALARTDWRCIVCEWPGTRHALFAALLLKQAHKGEARSRGIFCHKPCHQRANIRTRRKKLGVWYQVLWALSGTRGYAKVVYVQQPKWQTQVQLLGRHLAESLKIQRNVTL